MDAPFVAAALTLASATGAEFPDGYSATRCRAAGCSGVATFNRKDFARLGIELALL